MTFTETRYSPPSNSLTFPGLYTELIISEVIILTLKEPVL